MLEYFHRLAASVVGLILVIALVWSWTKKAFRKPLAPWITAAFLLLGVQINLGRLTVTELLKAEIVAMHLGTAVIIFALLLIATRHAYHLESGNRVGSRIQASKGFLRVTWLAIVVLFVQIMLGGSVSANYAGLACPDFPTCNSLWFPGFDGRVGIQFIHRLGAIVATLALLFFMFRWKDVLPSKPSTKGGQSFPVYWSRFPCFIGVLLVIQWLLGVGMILLGGTLTSMRIPPPLSVTHLGVGLTLISLVICAYVEFRPDSKKLP